MKPLQSVQYRLKLAEGFLREAQQDLKINRWCSCVDNAQLTVENALKALIALWVPVPRTHRPGATHC
jgi:HEPN domain-containing protein